MSDEFLREMSRYATLGISTVMVMPLDNEPVAFVERLGAEGIPSLATL